MRYVHTFTEPRPRGQPSSPCRPAQMAGGLLVAFALTAPGWAQAEQVTWTFDNLKTIGGVAAHPEGKPTVIDTLVGKALQFDGDDSLLIDARPLTGAKIFTIEAIFRPEGGPFGQRFMHMAETDPATGMDALPSGTADPNPRFMFEVRVVLEGWYLDAFVNSKSGSMPLIDATKIHPLNRWYAVAQTYDGTTYRAYVDGVLQAEAKTPFTPLGPGRVRVGSRMNRIDYFHGSVAKARFTDQALSTDKFLTVPRSTARAGDSFSTKLMTAAYQPPAEPFSGEGQVEAVLDGRVLTIDGRFTGLSSPATKAGVFAGAAVGMPGAPIFALKAPNARSGDISGKFRLSADQAASLRGQKLYVQVDTQDAQDGALWGWLMPSRPYVPQGVPEQQNPYAQ